MSEMQQLNLWAEALNQTRNSYSSLFMRDICLAKLSMSLSNKPLNAESYGQFLRHLQIYGNRSKAVKDMGNFVVKLYIFTKQGAGLRATTKHLSFRMISWGIQLLWARFF